MLFIYVGYVPDFIITTNSTCCLWTWLRKLFNVSINLYD